MRTVLLLLFLLAAIAFYIRGSVYGAFGFIVLGMLFELAFWLGLIGRRRQ